MTHEQGQALSQYICKFYCGAADKSVKTAGNYFQQQNISQSTVYYILKIYLPYETTRDLSRSDRPVKLSMKNLNTLVKSISNRCARSQRKLGHDFECIIRLFPVVFNNEHRLLYENVKKLQKWIQKNNRDEHEKTMANLVDNC